MAVRTGLEPATSCVTGRHSNQLNYRTKLRGQDSNLRPSGYEPDELPDCSTPRRLSTIPAAPSRSTSSGGADAVAGRNPPGPEDLRVDAEEVLPTGGERREHPLVALERIR